MGDQDEFGGGPEELRARCRTGAWSRPTTGLCPGKVQASEAAFDFLLFCQRNPKPCPIVEVIEAGRTEPSCAPHADLRTDLPKYRIYRDGELAEEVTDVSAYWRDDLVSFLLGCSFSFEDALLEAGVPVRHIALGRNVPMYRTGWRCTPAGRFNGPLVVSMRPIPAQLIPRAVQVTGRFERVHGAPVHVGAPEVLEIANLDQPHYGEAVPIHAGELPVFWACGVTPQAVALASRLPFCITHAPGHMFVTDLRNANFQ
jgi:uncharacterized protein YcsI (UPF0317 family)